MSDAAGEVKEFAEAEQSEQIDAKQSDPKQDTEQDASEKDGERGTKRSAPDSTDSEIKVTSANDWEHAELGDDGRKNKFLRLMGASKKEHHGKFVIGDKDHAADRSADTTNKLSDNLESQYEQSMAHRLQGGRRGHIGLGFQGEEKPTEEAGDGDKTVSSATETPEEPKDTKPEDTEPLPDSSTELSSERKSENKYGKFGFVKSSS